MVKTMADPACWSESDTEKYFKHLHQGRHDSQLRKLMELDPEKDVLFLQEDEDRLIPLLLEKIEMIEQVDAQHQREEARKKSEEAVLRTPRRGVDYGGEGVAEEKAVEVTLKTPGKHSFVSPRKDTKPKRLTLEAAAKTFGVETVERKTTQKREKRKGIQEVPVPEDAKLNVRNMLETACIESNTTDWWEWRDTESFEKHKHQVFM